MNSGKTYIVCGSTHYVQAGYCNRHYLQISGKDIHLGLFDNYEDALLQRMCAEQQYFGTFAPRKETNE